MKIFCKLTFFFLLISNLVYAQWKEVTFNGNGTPVFIKALNSKKAIINTHDHPDNYLYYTEDGGELWKEISMPNVKQFYNYMARDFAFTSLNKIWIVADSSVYFTSDKGINWRVQKKLSKDYYMQYIEMFDSSNGIASAENYNGKKVIILRTTNGGLSWTEIIPNLFDGAYFYHQKWSMSFVSNNVGFFMPAYDDNIANERLYKTNSGGLSWTMTNFNNDTKVGHYLKFVDDKTGYVFYRNYSPGILYKTVDGGTNWERVLELTEYLGHEDGRIGLNNKYPEFVSFACYQSFWVSNDYGKTWLKFDITQSQFGSCNDISITDRNTGWLITGEGVGEIYICDNISTITKIDEENKLMLDFGLEQNYPNPFNPVTTIKYSIKSKVKSEKSNVKLIAYDVIGNEIATLVNEQKSTGNYEVKFDASNLSSGIYYYQLTTGDFIKTNKMVYLK